MFPRFDRLTAEPRSTSCWRSTGSSPSCSRPPLPAAFVSSVMVSRLLFPCSIRRRKKFMRRPIFITKNSFSVHKKFFLFFGVSVSYSSGKNKMLEGEIQDEKSGTAQKTSDILLYRCADCPGPAQHLSLPPDAPTGDRLRGLRHLPDHAGGPGGSGGPGGGGRDLLHRQGGPAHALQHQHLQRPISGRPAL